MTRAGEYDVRGKLITGDNVVIDKGCIFEGDCFLGDNVKVGAYCIIRETSVGDNTEILPFSYLDDTIIGNDCKIGPYARTRDSVVIEHQVVIGNFVEIKNSFIGEKTHAKHLTYLGDAVLGKRVNIGCGTVTCNYDGTKKNNTVIENDAFIGSGTMIIAPVNIGKGAMTAAGTAITKDVPDGHLGIGRANQMNIDRRHKKENKPVVSNNCECHACIKEFDLKDVDGFFPLSSSKMILCPECGNKRCPKVSDHRLECTNSNEPGQVGSVY